MLTNIQNLPFETFTLKAGSLIFKEGELPQGLYFLETGCVKIIVHREHSRGRTTSSDYVTKLISPGELFGYKALIRGGPSHASAETIQNSIVRLYSKEHVLTMLENSNPLVKNLLEQAVTDLENYEVTTQLHYLASVQERIAYQLVLLADKFGVQTEQGISLNLKLTRNEFAQLASTINESLSRHLSDFKEEGLIELNGKEIIIKNKNSLMMKSGNFKS